MIRTSTLSFRFLALSFVASLALHIAFMSAQRPRIGVTTLVASYEPLQAR